ncbi:MAG: hypothetical protein IJ890_00025 [Clostridia bacterium]|nr:hypothetical protein [Clostridia bacterium]
MKYINENKLYDKCNYCCNFSKCYSLSFDRHHIIDIQVKDNYKCNYKFDKEKYLLK